MNTKDIARRLRAVVRRTGIDIVRYRPEGRFVADIDADTIRIAKAVDPFTLTSTERIAAMVEAVRYVSRSGIEGAVVECGVWRGGSMLAAALALEAEGDTARDLYLFDTFEGMVAPSELDVKSSGSASSLRDSSVISSGEPASKQFVENTRADGGSDWCFASLEEVRRTMSGSSYPPSRVHYVQGKVEDTIPDHAPELIALLRLDTDWYESTRHELEHLVPRMAPFGVVIIDDYGAWDGARKAVDDYLASMEVPILLHRIDESGRSFVVPGSSNSAVPGH